MKFFIGVISENVDVRRFVGRRKESLIPEDFRKGTDALVREIAAATWDPAAGSADDLADFLLDHVAAVDGALLLVNESRADLIEGCAPAFHVVLIPDQKVGKSLQNFLQMYVAAGLRNFRRLAAMMRRGDDGRLLQLPIRNFVAPELREIARLAMARGGDGELAGQIEQQMVQLRRRVRPRKRSDYKHTYAVDDEKKFFRFGHERHGSFATGGDHTPTCELRGHFRFGHRLDCQRHYNVSTGEGDTTTIQGEFLNCHDEVETFAARSHLNMFSNDNIR